jgi:CubicO group peptidase (beta-lactamase class C family)
MLREAATRVDPSPPAQGSVYSDLGYLVAGEVIARASGLTLDAAVQRELTGPLRLTDELYYAAALTADAQDALRVQVAPTEFCAFRHRLVRGEVHVENCAMYGGIAGHAGLFGTVHGVLGFGRAMLEVLEGRSLFVDRALLAWALTPRRGGGYVVGWDTRSAQGSSAGSLFSTRAFGHLGFTGTSIWCDPARSLCAVLLTNRVHPTRDNIKIREFRPRFHDAVISAWFGGM